MRSQDHLKAVLAFQEKYPEREEREKALWKMNDDEIDVLTNSCSMAQGKIYYSKFRKTPFPRGIVFRLERSWERSMAEASIFTVYHREEDNVEIINPEFSFDRKLDTTVQTATLPKEDLDRIISRLQDAEKAFDYNEFEEPLGMILDGEDDHFWFSDCEGRIREFVYPNFFASFRGIAGNTQAGEIVGICDYIEEILNKNGIQYFSGASFQDEGDEMEREPLEDYSNPDWDPDVLRKWYEQHHDHQNLASAYAEAWAGFVYTEDCQYDCEEDAPEYEEMCRLTDRWNKLHEELGREILDVMRGEGMEISEGNEQEAIAGFISRYKCYDRVR